MAEPVKKVQGGQVQIQEGQVKKGGQNPPNTTSQRPAPPQGSNGKGPVQKAK